MSLGDKGGFYFFAAVLGLLGLSGVVVVFFLPLPRDSLRVVFWSCLRRGSVLLPCYSLRFVFWSRLRRVTFQRWKVTKDRRACGPGPGVGGRRNRYGACKSFGCYPPFWPPPSTLRPLAPRADIPPAKLVGSFVGGAGPHAAFRTTIFYLMVLGSSRCGNKSEVLRILRYFMQN